MATKEELERKFMQAHNMAKLATDPAEAERHRSNAQLFKTELEKVQDDTRSIESVNTMLSNIPGDAMKVGGEFLSMLTSPIDTAKSMQSIGQGVFEKAFVPNEINGMDFGETENEEAVNSLVSALKDDYGSWDATRRTMRDKPFQAGLDMAGVGTTLAAGGAKGVNLVAKAVSPDMPRNMMSEALRLRPGLDPKKKRNIVDTIVTEGIDPRSTAGLDKGYDLLFSLNKQIDDLIAATPPGAEIPRSAIFKHFGDVKKDVGGVNLQGGKNLEAVNKVAKQFDEHMKSLGKDTITPQELQKFKKDAYADINFDREMQQSNAATDKARMAAARSAREQLEEWQPDIADINKREGALIEALQELPSTVNKMENYRPIGIDAALKTLTGSAVGSPFGPVGTAIGGTAGAISGALAHPRVRAGNALLLEALRRTAPASQAMVDKISPALVVQALLASREREGDITR